jgi:beta-glucosidase
VVSGLEALTRRAETFGATVQFAPGYTLTAAPPDPELIAAARDAASTADVVVLFLGLPGQYEAEGRDRTSIDLPDNQIALLQALAGTDAPTVVALSNGSAVTTASWRQGVSAIVEFWLTGQAHGDTIADVLLGDVNPSGKLAETIPVRLSDTRRFSTSPASRATYGTARASTSATATTTRDPSEWTIPSATAFPTRPSRTPILW